MRPKIGLALGSGAARGWSQIGIIESLAAFGIVPSIVCGTSIGALVGAAFAAGRLDALKSRIENFGRRDVAAMFDIKLASGGLIEGKRVEALLETIGVTGSIEALKIKYGAVATDLATGREIWFQAGPIGHAVRASIGMPGVFSPTEHTGGGWLIDGGLVNPVPVSLARAMGADIVIAVDLNSELVGRRFEGLTASAAAPETSSRVPDWLHNALGPLLGRVLQGNRGHPSYFEVLANSLNIMQDRITRSRLAGDPPDVVLRPALGNFSWLDFHRAKDAIAEGSACANAAKDAIERACRNAMTGTA